MMLKIYWAQKHRLIIKIMKVINKIIRLRKKLKNESKNTKNMNN